MPGLTAEEITELKTYLEVCNVKLGTCLDSLPDPLLFSNPLATARFHHLRLDGNGQPLVRELAHSVADFAVEYAFSGRMRGRPKIGHERSRLDREARSLLRKRIESGRTGEAGEMLLYYLMEAVLGAPQMVAKLDLKTNPNMELHGSDGLHMRYNEVDAILEVFFGEAKVEKTIYSALDNAFESLNNFHEEGLFDRELHLVTSHYKWAEGSLQRRVTDIVERRAPDATFRTHHALLIGYDWDEYANIAPAAWDAMTNEFRQRFTDDKPRIQALLKKRFDEFPKKHLRFEVFVLPFRTVDDFREKFLETIS